MASSFLVPWLPNVPLPPPSPELVSLPIAPHQIDDVDAQMGKWLTGKEIGRWRMIRRRHSGRIHGELQLLQIHGEVELHWLWPIPTVSSRSMMTNKEERDGTGKKAGVPSDEEDGEDVKMASSSFGTCRKEDACEGVDFVHIWLWILLNYRLFVSYHISSTLPLCLPTFYFSVWIYRLNHVFAYLPIPCLQDAASALPDLHILHATIAWYNFQTKSTINVCYHGYKLANIEEVSVW